MGSQGGGRAEAVWGSRKYITCSQSALLHSSLCSLKPRRSRGKEQGLWRHSRQGKEMWVHCNRDEAHVEGPSVEMEAQTEGL